MPRRRSSGNCLCAVRYDRCADRRPNSRRRRRRSAPRGVCGSAKRARTGNVSAAGRKALDRAVAAEQPHAVLFGGDRHEVATLRLRQDRLAFHAAEPVVVGKIHRVADLGARARRAKHRTLPGRRCRQRRDNGRRFNPRRRTARPAPAGSAARRARRARTPFSPGPSPITTTALGAADLARRAAPAAGRPATPARCRSPRSPSTARATSL